MYEATGVLALPMLAVEGGAGNVESDLEGGIGTLAGGGARPVTGGAGSGCCSSGLFSEAFCIDRCRALEASK